MLVEHQLDAREMMHPEPFEKSTAILQALRSGEYLRMLHRRIPYPLIDYCKALNLNFLVDAISQNSYEIIIYFPTDIEDLNQESILKVKGKRVDL